MARLPALVIAILLGASPVRAESVLVFETAGGKSTTSTIVQTLTTELAGHEIARVAAPKGWKAVNVKLAAQVAKAAAAQGAAVGVASELSKSRRAQSLAVLAVMADGRVVYDRSVKLPKKNADKKIKELVRAMARSIGEELAARQPVAPVEPSPTPDSTAQPLVPRPVLSSGSAEEGGTAASLSTVPLLGGKDEPEVELSTPRRRRGESAFHAALRVGGGGLTMRDSISTTIQGGDLSIGVGFTVLTVAGLELALGNWLTFSADFHRYGATIVHSYEDDPDTLNVVEPSVRPTNIGATGFGTTALLGTGMDIGGLTGGLAAGVSYASFSADPQRLVTAAGEETAALVPSWARLAALAGVTLSYGNLGREGLAGQLGLMVVPWGSHAEEPLTSGESSSVLGVNGWLRLRYQLPDLFGAAGGMFGEVSAFGDFARLQYKGNGTRKALGGTDPVQASKETRLVLGTALAVGYVY